MYRQIKSQAFTRRKYMGGVPSSRITQFDMGTANGDFPIILSLKVKESKQIRHTALEAARIAANRVMSKQAGTANYHLKVRPYPHNVLRENKLATGAGADRVSSGMRHSFGKNVGTAARVKADQKIITVRTSKQFFDLAKEALWRASMKLPSPCYIDIDQGAEMLK